MCPCTYLWIDYKVYFLLKPLGCRTCSLLRPLWVIPSILIVSLHLGLQLCHYEMAHALWVFLESCSLLRKYLVTWSNYLMYDVTYSANIAFVLRVQSIFFHFLHHIPPLLLPPPYHCKLCLVGFPQLFLQMLNELFFVFDSSWRYNYLAIDALTNGAEARACAGFGSGVVPGAGSWTRSRGQSGTWAVPVAIAGWCCWRVHNWLCLDVFL